jgi:histidinol-phosphate aminotransferase
MSLSRRAFFRNLGAGPADSASREFIAARGREALVNEMWRTGLSFEETEAQMPQMPADAVMISSNENPLGPGPAAYQALLDGLDQQAGRYPTNFRPSHRDLMQTIADKFDARVENITLGTGSGEILENSAKAFTGPDKALITADPSYLQAVGVAERHGHPVHTVPLDANLRLDSEGIARAARGAGLIFLCNPNNPSSTVVPASDIEALVREVRSSSPDTRILIDEAYHDYVTDPAHQTAIPLALRTPNVYVARTFSKAYGMAGLRLGYAAGQPETLARLRSAWGLGDVNVLTASAAVASLHDQAHMDQEREENHRIRDFTIGAFKEMGHTAADSQTNFLFVDIGRTAREFREACAARGVRVGRDFPPMEKTHARISIGTMDEMQRAVAVFREVLTAPMTSSATRQ